LVIAGQRAARTRVKICGITRPADGVAAAVLGVDAIGLVFYPPSPRAVDRQRAQAIVAALPPFVTAVGIFVDPEPDAVQAVLEAVAIDVLQFHGEEAPAECGRYGRPYIKSIRVRPGVDVEAQAARYASAQGLLLDTWRADLWGGSGEAFDWRLVPRRLPRPIILAGGLTPENVAEAVHAVRPFAVDVSGGVESAKGIKDPQRMAAFVRGIERVETTEHAL